MELLASQQPGKGNEIQLTDAMARSLDREAMYAVVIDPLSGYDTGTPSGWIATNALMGASDPRFAGEFWAAIDERGGLEHERPFLLPASIVMLRAVDWRLSGPPRFAFFGGAEACTCARLLFWISVAWRSEYLPSYSFLPSRASAT